MKFKEGFGKKVLHIAIILFIVSPFLCTIIFSVPNADDFAMASAIHGDRLLLFEACEKAWKFYLSQAGEIPINFLQFLINPLVHFNPTGFGLGIELELLFLIFIWVLWLYIKKITALCNIRNDKAIFSVYAITLFAFVNSMVYFEIYYWFVGDTYLIALVFTLINQMLIFKLYNNEFSVRNVVILSIVGFIACFSYQFAVFSGIVYVIEILKSNVRIKKRIIPLFFMILGGLISVFSPGNMDRHDRISTGFSLLHTFLYVVQNIYKCIIEAYNNPFIYVMVIVALIVGVLYAKDDRDINILYYFIAGVLSLAGTLFPIALGYSSSELNNRLYFLTNINIYLWSLIMAIKLGMHIKANNENLCRYIDDKKWTIVFIIIILAIVIEFEPLSDGNIRYQKMPWVRTAQNIENCYNESNYYKGIISLIIDSSEKNVVINTYPYDSQTQIIKPLEIPNDKENWINVGIARWAKKESVVLEYIY